MYNHNSNKEEMIMVKQVTSALCVAMLSAGVLLSAGCGGSSQPASSSSSASSSSASSSSAQKQEAPKKQESLQEQGLKDQSVSQDYRNALKKGITYANMMHMSKQGVYNQLTSQADQFPPEAAKWAVEHMSDIDWNKNALEKAKTYQKDMAMSRGQVQEQLASEVEGFTPEEVKYAIEHLPQ